MKTLPVTATSNTIRLASILHCYKVEPHTILESYPDFYELEGERILACWGRTRDLGSFVSTHSSNLLSCHACRLALSYDDCWVALNQFIRLSVHLSISLSIHVSVVCLSVPLFIHLCVICLSVHSSVYLSVCPLICLLSVSPVICLSFFLSVQLISCSQL